MAAAILALVSYNMMQVGLYGLFGFSLATLLSTSLGVSIPWWAAALLGWVVVAALGVNSVDLSAKVLGVLVALEFVVVTVVSVLALVSAPEGISAEPLQPSSFFAGGVGVLLSLSLIHI